MTTSTQSAATQMATSVEQQPSLIVRYWRPAVLAATVAVVFGPTLAILGRQWWEDPNYSHGLVLPFLCAFIIWRQKQDLASVPLKPTWWGAMIVIFSLLVLLVGSLGAELFLTRIAFWGTCVGLVLYFAGLPLLRKLAFPIGLF